MRPLAVSANVIGTMAMRCADLQAQLGDCERAGTGELVEVYPAAALKSWGLPHEGGKTNENDQSKVRQQIFE